MSGEPIPAVVGLDISRIELIGLIRIRFGLDANAPELSIESAFEVTGADGSTVTVSFSPATGAEPTGLDGLGTLYGQTVDDAVIREDGSIHIAFANAAAITVPVDPNYEAGHFVLPEDYLVIPPGGR